MPVYTVHAPITGSASASASTRADKMIFVRDGFYVWALIFGPFWIAFNRLWLVLVGYLVVTGLLEGAMALLRTPDGAQGWAMLLVNLLLALEASTLRRWTLKRNGFAPAGVAVGKNLEDAERNFFANTHRDDLPRASEANSDSMLQSASSFAPVASLSPNPVSAVPADASRPVIGLFPERGGSR